MHADLWNQSYFLMMEAVIAAKQIPNALITDQVANMIGSGPPQLSVMSSQSIQNGLAAKKLDVGMCGFFITIERLQNFDFVNPFYLPSGFQAVVVRPTKVPSMLDILSAVIACVDSKAQLIILILLLFVFIFGHILAGAEHLAISVGQNIRSGYFEATMDGMWLSVVTMSTVGFGDLFPKSMFARFLTVVWIFISISLMAMLLAVITASFLLLEFVPDDPVYHISGMTDLAAFSVVTATALAQTVIQREIPDVNITKFPTNSQPEVFRALLNGSFQVAVERPETIQYFNNLVPEFNGRLMPVGIPLYKEGVSFGVSRPGGQEHPIYRLFAQSVASIVGMEAQFQPLRQKWFGAEQSAADSDANFIRRELKNRAINDLLWVGVKILLVVVGAWIFLSCLAVVLRIPRHAVRNETCAAVRVALGVTEEEVLPGCHYTLGYHALKGRVLAGIRHILAEDESSFLSPAQVEEAMSRSEPCSNGLKDQSSHLDLSTDVGDSNGETASISQPQEKTTGRDMAADGTGNWRWRQRLAGMQASNRIALPKSCGAESTGEDMTLVNVGALLDLFAGVLAARRPRATWWERLSGVDYARRSREYVRESFFACYAQAQVVFEELRPLDKDSQALELTADDMADVLMALLTTEVRSLLADGSVLFPHRTGGSDFSDQERSFDQLTRTAQELEARVDHADTAAAAAHSAATGALDTAERLCRLLADPVAANNAALGAPDAETRPREAEAAASAAEAVAGAAPRVAPVPFRHRISRLSTRTAHC